MELNKTFIDGLWSKEINVSDFVSTNIAPYTGDASFLKGPTERTTRIWNLCLQAIEEERANNGVRALDNTTVSTITSHKAGYIDQENELIVGLQTDELLKRAIKPFGGINVVAKACRENGVEVDEKVKDTEHRSLLSKITHSFLSSLEHRKICNLLVIQEYTTCIWNNETGNHIETCCLSCSIRAKKSYNFSLINLHRNTLYDCSGAVLLNKIFAM